MTKEIQRLRRLLKIENADLDIAIRALEQQRRLVDLAEQKIMQLNRQIETILDCQHSKQSIEAGTFINRMQRIDGCEQQLLKAKSLNSGLKKSLEGARQAVLNRRMRVEGTELRIKNLAMERKKEQEKLSENEILDHVLQQPIGNEQ